MGAKTVSRDGPDTRFTQEINEGSHFPLLSLSQACSLRVAPLSAWSDRPLGLSSASARPEVSHPGGAGAQRSQPPGGGWDFFQRQPGYRCRVCRQETLTPGVAHWGCCPGPGVAPALGGRAACRARPALCLWRLR